MLHRSLAIAMAASLTVTVSAQNRTHDLPLKPENIEWGYYDGSVKPVLRVASGDTVRVETMVARGLERLRRMMDPARGELFLRSSPFGAGIEGFRE